MTKTILLGAGASAAAGVHTARDMVKHVHEASSSSDDVRQAINLAIGGLRFRRSVTEEQPFEDIDVEDLYEALKLLSKRSESFLAPFVGSWSSPVLAIDRGNSRDAADRVTRAIDQAIAVSTQFPNNRSVVRRDPVPTRDLLRLKQSLEDGFASNGSQDPSVFEIAAERILQVLVQCAWLEDSSKVSYLEPLVNSARNSAMWIATLNYDNTVELAAQTLGIPVDTGLQPDGTVSLDARGANGRVTLVKLHGSVDWSYDHNGVLLRNEEPGSNPALIFGSGNKLQVEGPHLDLLFTFRDRLRMTDDLLVCGYSFRDRHVNHFILEWLKGAPNRRIQVYDPFLTVPRIVTNMGRSLRPGWKLSSEQLEKQLDLRTANTDEWVKGFTTPSS